jgi:hypothetical protein
VYLLLVMMVAETLVAETLVAETLVVETLVETRADTWKSVMSPPPKRPI